MRLGRFFGGSVAIKLGVLPRAISKPNLNQSNVFLDFVVRTLHFAVFPHLSRHHEAAAASIGRNKEAWNWIQSQVRTGIQDPEWGHKELISNIGASVRRLFRRIGNCRDPLYSSLKLASDLRELWRIVSGRRMKANAWRIESSHSGCAAFWEAVCRNSDRARRRRLWELAVSKAAGNGQILTEDAKLSLTNQKRWPNSHVSRAASMSPPMTNLFLRYPRTI